MPFRKRSWPGKLTALLLVVVLLMAQAVTPIFASEGYSFLLKWGSQGSDDAEFFNPDGIAIDASGNVYVVDTGNARIQKFDFKGGYITQWGGYGEGDGELRDPMGVAIDASGNVYVADRLNDRIQKFDSAGSFVTKWGSQGSGDGQFVGPTGVAVDTSGNVYVTEFVNHRIQKFDSDGRFLAKWGSQGSGDGQFDQPYGIAVDGSGNVYVADRLNNRIQKFDSAGNFIAKWGSQGSADGQFVEPRGIALDTSANVYVADTGNDRIQKFDSAGNYVAKWGSNGSGDGQFDRPQGIAVDKTGDVYVTEFNNHRIQKFRKTTHEATVTADVREIQPILTFIMTAGTAPEGGSVSDSAIDFGPLVPNSPKTGSHFLTVATNAAGGYTVTVEEDTALTSGPNQIADVTGDNRDITEVEGGAWEELTTYGFGYTLSGGDAVFTARYKQFANRELGKTPQVIMSNDDPVDNSQVELTYKVNIGPGQAAGTYSNTITYIITGNF